MDASSGRWVAVSLAAVAALEGTLAVAFLILAAVTPIRFFALPGGILAIVAIGLALGSRTVAATDRRRQALLTTGTAATATVVSMTQSPVMRNGSPRVTLRLSVTVPGHPAYEVTAVEWVPLIYVGRLTDGKPLAVRIDPTDPQRVAVDWAG